jgi:hypothetical protein
MLPLARGSGIARCRFESDPSDVDEPSGIQRLKAGRAKTSNSDRDYSLTARSATTEVTVIPHFDRLCATRITYASPAECHGKTFKNVPKPRPIVNAFLTLNAVTEG